MKSIKDILDAYREGLISDEESRELMGLPVPEPDVIVRRYRKVYRVSAKSWTASNYGGKQCDSLDEAMAELRKFIEDGHWAAEVAVEEKQVP